MEAKEEKYRFRKGSDWISFPAFASVAFHPCAHFSNRAFCQIAFLFCPDNSFHSFYFYCILFHEIMHLVDIKVLKSDLDCSDCLYSCGSLFTRCCSTDAVWCLIWPILPTSPPLSTENKNAFLARGPLTWACVSLRESVWQNPAPLFSPHSLKVISV